MDILNLTSTEAIRATIGASTEDLSDSNILESDIEAELQVNLLEWLPAYDTIRDAGVVTGSSDAETLAYQHLQLYSKYFCADIVNRASNFAMAQMISDGENEVQRFQDNQWERLTDSIRRRMAVHRKYLITYAKSVLSGADETTSYSQFGKATPAFDPITGETT